MKNSNKIILMFLLLSSLLIIGCGDSSTAETSHQDMFNDAYVSFEQGNYNSALSGFINLEKSISSYKEVSSDELVTVNSYIAMCYSNLEKPNKAIEYYTKAISLDNTVAGLYFARASNYAMIGDEDSMMRDVELAEKYGLDVDAIINSEESFDPIVDHQNSNTNKKSNEYDFDSMFKNLDAATDAVDELLAIERAKAPVSYKTFNLYSETHGLVDDSVYDPRDDLRDSPLLVGLTFKGDIAVGLNAPDKELENIVDKLEIKEITSDELISKSKTARDNIKDEYILSGKILDISIDDSNVDTEYFNGEIYFAIQLTDDEFKTADPYNCGFIYYSDNGNTYIEKGILNIDSKKLYVPITHFSIYEYFFGKAKAPLDAMIESEAKRYSTILNSNIEAKILEIAQNNQFINGLDSQMKSKVLNNLFANKDRLAELAAAAGGDSSVNVGKSISLWFGKTVIDSIPEDKLADVFGGSALKGIIDNIDTVDKATGELMKGNYWKTVGVVGGDFFDNSNAGLVLKGGIEGWKIAIKAGEDTKFNEMFDNWKSTGMKSDFWSDSHYKKSYSALYRQYKMHHGCYGSKAGDDSAAKSCIEKLFKNRLESDKQVAVEKAKIETLRDLYTSSSTFIDSSASSRAKGIRDRFKEDNGRSPTEVEAFKTFLNKAREIEVNLAQLGIEGPYWNKNRMSEESYELLTGYIANGNDGYKKAFKKLMDKHDKHLNLVKKCTSDSDCELKEICDKKTSFCKKVTCTMNGDCDNREICKDNECIPGCDNEFDCFTGEYCSKEGQCVSGCQGSSDCNLDEVCKDGECVFACRASTDCSNGQVCKNSICIAGCELDFDCKDGQICKNSVCIVGCSFDLDCNTGYSCVSNNCIADETDDDGYLDENEDMDLGLSTGGDATVGTTGSLGGCSSNSDCYSHEVCHGNNKCGSDCSSDMFCQEFLLGDFCDTNTGICHDNGQEECLSTQVRSTDGGCICAGALPWWNKYIGACVAAECNAPNSHVEGWYKSDCECDNNYYEAGYDSRGEIICKERE